MKIAICDNEAIFREQIQEILREYAAQNPSYDITPAVFERSDDLLEAAQRIGGYDIYLLDILMPGMNGIELGVQLRKSGFNGRILYLTSSREYAIDAFQAKAYNYLLKPLQKEALLAAIDEAVRSLAARLKKSILVKTKGASIRLPLEQIMYADISRRSIVYHLAGGRTVESVMIRISFSEAVQELLRDSRFALCGTSMVANLQYITMVESDALIFQERERIFLSKKACREIRSAWYDFWFDEEDTV